ncbi:MAG TPA: hypothetical protein VF722_18425 [Gemmatimonadaceae bacterium]
MSDSYHLPLRVVRLVATRPPDPERGPMVWLRGEDAASRLLVEGELVWVIGPRRRELATVGIDDSLPRGDVVLRDIVGASPSEDVKVLKVNTDEPPRRGILA